MSDKKVSMTVELDFNPTPGFLAWSQQKGKERELGCKILVADKFYMSIDERMKKQLESQVTSAIATKMLDESLIPLSVELFEERDVPLRATELVVLVNTCFEPFIMPYALQLEKKYKRTQELLKLPWWKLAWLRLRGNLQTK